MWRTSVSEAAALKLTFKKRRHDVRSLEDPILLEQPNATLFKITVSGLSIDNALIPVTGWLDIPMLLDFVILILVYSLAPC